jgi:hypothetical protein
MSKTKKYMIASLGSLLLLGVFVFDRPEVAAQQVKPPQQVLVVNPPASPALVENAPRTPFSTQTNLNLTNMEFAGDFAYTVPSGKRMVIEFASVWANVFLGEGGFVTIQPRDSLGVQHTYFFTGTTLPGTTSLIIGSQEMRLYSHSAGGGQVAVFFRRTNYQGGIASAIVSLSGYLVDE